MCVVLSLLWVGIAVWYLRRQRKRRLSEHWLHARRRDLGVFNARSARENLATLRSETATLESDTADLREQIDSMQLIYADATLMLDELQRAEALPSDAPSRSSSDSKGKR